jgi:hypothetical protein
MYAPSATTLRTAQQQHSRLCDLGISFSQYSRSGDLYWQYQWAFLCHPIGRHRTSIYSLSLQHFLLKRLGSFWGRGNNPRYKHIIQGRITLYYSQLDGIYNGLVGLYNSRSRRLAENGKTWMMPTKRIRANMMGYIRSIGLKRWNGFLSWYRFFQTIADIAAKGSWRETDETNNIPVRRFDI